jgi:hypothetical protein
MTEEPVIEGGEVEDEAGDDDGRTVDIRDFDHPLALGRAQALDEGEGALVVRVGGIEEMDHHDGAGRRHCVTRPDRAFADLLEDLVSLVEAGARHLPAVESKRARAGRGPASSVGPGVSAPRREAYYTTLPSEVGAIAPAGCSWRGRARHAARRRA